MVAPIIVALLVGGAVIGYLGTQFFAWKREETLYEKTSTMTQSFIPLVAVVGVVLLLAILLWKGL